MAQDLVNVVSLGSIYLLFALGMSLAWGTIDILNFGHGSLFMFSAFVAYLIARDATLPLAVTVGIGVAVGALLSVATQVFAFEQIIARAKDRQTAHMQILIGGIGVATIPLAIAQHVTKSNPFGLERGFETVTYTVAGLRISNIDFIIVGSAAVLGAAIGIWLKRSRNGLALRTVGVDAEVASMMGVNRRGLAIATMAIAGGLAGLAGVLFTYKLGAITPETGDGLLLKAFAVIILGGVGSTLGVVVGSYFLAFAETMVLTHTSGLWVNAVAFGMILAVLLLKPDGIFGRAVVRRT